LYELILFVDSHAHLSGKEFDNDRYVVIERAFREGVGAILCPTELTEENELQITLETVKKYPNIIASGGVHPHNAKSFNPSCIQKIKDLAESRNIHAVGEIGIDFHYNFSPPETQIEVFRKQLNIAQEVGLPVVIHSRNARDEVLKAIKDEAFTQGGILHCFTEDWEFAAAMMEHDFLISFSGILTFPKAHSLRDVAIKTPLKKTLIETDSPYLVPTPYRGRIQRNEPVYVKETAGFLAELKKVSMDKLAEKTTHNFESLFQIEIKKLRC
jgi:TatD DNase family protein